MTLKCTYTFGNALAPIDPDPVPIRRPGTRAICTICCGFARLGPARDANGREAIITACPMHPGIMIQNGKVIGTSA